MMAVTHDAEICCFRGPQITLKSSDSLGGSAYSHTYCYTLLQQEETKKNQQKESACEEKYREKQA